jgi:hypothetical protein
MRIEKWQLSIACVALVWAFFACSKSDTQETVPAVAPSAPVTTQVETAVQPLPAPKSEEQDPDPQAVPIPADFEAKAEAEINQNNYLKELDRIEKDINQL